MIMDTALSAPMRDLLDRGYIIDEWNTWQQGHCGIYAAALIRNKPGLRLGTVVDRYFDEDDQCTYDNPVHFFAYDDTYAYDSAGRHLLPYTGVHDMGWLCVLDQEPQWYGEEVPVDDEYGEDSDMLTAAWDHATRHSIFG